MNLYERLGKTIEERDQESAQHVLTLKLLHKLKAGELALDDVTLTDNGWRLREPVLVERETPTTPFRDNGPSPMRSDSRPKPRGGGK